MNDNKPTPKKEEKFHLLLKSICLLLQRKSTAAVFAQLLKILMLNTITDARCALFQFCIKYRLQNQGSRFVREWCFKGKREEEGRKEGGGGTLRRREEMGSMRSLVETHGKGGKRLSFIFWSYFWCYRRLKKLMGKKKRDYSNISRTGQYQNHIMIDKATN